LGSQYLVAGNAKLAGLEKDLHLKGYDYNRVLSVFYISYIIFEIPANMACKWVGPGWFIPLISLGFGVCSICTAFVDNIHSASGVRFLLGMFEAGMLPGIAYYLSRWYRRSELAFRLSLYIVMAPLAGAFGGLLASGILKLSHFGSLHRWRMIFGIEGIITCGLSLIAFFTLTDRPATARWLSQEEKDLAIARVKSERVGTTEVLDKLDVRKVLLGIFSPVTLSTAFIFLLNNITVQGLAFFLPTIVKTIYPEDSVVSQQLHTVPPYVRIPNYPIVMFWKLRIMTKDALERSTETCISHLFPSRATPSFLLSPCLLQSESPSLIIRALASLGSRRLLHRPPPFP
jgi:MFS family permease